MAMTGSQLRITVEDFRKLLKAFPLKPNEDLLIVKCYRQCRDSKDSLIGKWVNIAAVCPLVQGEQGLHRQFGCVAAMHFKKGQFDDNLGQSF